MTMRWLAMVGFLVAALSPSDAAGHLFHKMYEPPENQMTRDTRLLQLVLHSFPTRRSSDLKSVV